MATESQAVLTGLGDGDLVVLSNAASFTACGRPMVTSASVVIAFGTSVLVVFGIYPAMKAFKISPIEGLRYE